jgi:hypothetical protein
MPDPAVTPRIKISAWLPLSGFAVLVSFFYGFVDWSVRSGIEREIDPVDRFDEAIYGADSASRPESSGY